MEVNAAALEVYWYLFKCPTQNTSHKVFQYSNTNPHLLNTFFRSREVIDQVLQNTINRQNHVATFFGFSHGNSKAYGYRYIDFPREFVWNYCNKMDYRQLYHSNIIGSVTISPPRQPGLFCLGLLRLHFHELTSCERLKYIVHSDGVVRHHIPFQHGCFELGLTTNNTQYKITANYALQL